MDWKVHSRSCGGWNQEMGTRVARRASSGSHILISNDVRTSPLEKQLG